MAPFLYPTLFNPAQSMSHLYSTLVILQCLYSAVIVLCVRIYIPLWLYYNPSGQPNRQPLIKTLTFCLSHFIRTQHSYFFAILILKNSLLSSRFHLLSLPHIIYIITRRQSQKPTCLIFFYADKLLLQPTFIPR